MRRSEGAFAAVKLIRPVCRYIYIIVDPFIAQADVVGSCARERAKGAWLKLRLTAATRIDHNARAVETKPGPPLTSSRQ